MASTEWSERKRLTVTVAVVVAINVGLGALAYKARSQWLEKEAALKKLNDDIKRLTGVAESKAAKKETKDKLEAENTARKSQLPDEDKRLNFMNLLSTLEQAYSVTDKSVNVPRYDQAVDIQGLSNPQNFLRDIWSRHYQADFKGLCEFLNRLEEHMDERFVSIENLSVNAPSSGMVLTGTKHEITLDVISYRYSAKAE